MRAPSSRSFDVVVVGGGPAGALGALELARAGLRVAVIEKEAPPRYKTCGGGVVPKARRLLEVDLDGAVAHSCFAAELNLMGADVRCRVERDEPLVTMTMRADLDALLLAAAAGAGAEVVASCAFEGLGRNGSAIVVETDRGTFEARYVVAADGARSRTARAAGWAANGRNVPALESELAVDAETWDRFAGCARFDFGIPSDGYAWVFPKRPGHLSAGCLATGCGARGLKRHLETYLHGIGLDGHRDREDHGFVISVAPRSGGLARGGVLLAGDAAGLADPVTCEGISHAAASGRLAARAIAEGFDDPARVERTYHQAVDSEILSDLRVARFFARLLYGCPRLRRFVFRRVVRPLAEGVADVISGRDSYSRFVKRAFRPLRSRDGPPDGMGGDPAPPCVHPPARQCQDVRAIDQRRGGDET